MKIHEQILEYIDKLLTPSLLYEILQLKTKTSIDLISHIVKKSNKTIPEAVSVFLAVIRYLWKDSGSLQDFIKENSHLICKLAIEKRAQANLPSRGLPLLEIFGKKIQASSILVIELGASFGLIGRCLLNPDRIIEKKDSYFPPKQQMPQNPLPINFYLAIELSPPDKEWALAWEWHRSQRERLKNFIEDIPVDKRFKLLKEDAFGFSTLNIVKELAGKHSTVVVLTSYMLYLNEEKKQKLLKDEILEFREEMKGHWINQAFNKFLQEYFIQLDEEKIIELSDDSSRSWKWLI